MTKREFVELYMIARAPHTETNLVVDADDALAAWDEIEKRLPAPPVIPKDWVIGPAATRIDSGGEHF